MVAEKGMFRKSSGTQSCKRAVLTRTVHTPCGVWTLNAGVPQWRLSTGYLPRLPRSVGVRPTPLSRPERSRGVGTSSRLGVVGVVTGGNDRVKG